MLRVAVQTKGRLNEDSMGLLADAGISIKVSKRKLIAKADNFDMEVLFLRDDDIPQAVADGVADVGVVGYNEYLEKDKDAEIIKHLGFSKCRLSLAIPKSVEYTGVEWFEGKKIATSYPVILQKFLDEKGVNAAVHFIAGSVEVAPSIGLADGIFDIVSSGSTLVSNRLAEVEVVAESDAVMIKNDKLTDLQESLLSDLLFRIETVEKAKGKRYLMLNAPECNLGKIEALLPGLNAPSVLPLAKEGWSSIHSVVDVCDFWALVKELKELGAESILLLPIENMVL